MFCICTLTASGPAGSGLPHVGHDELTPPGAPPPERHPSQQHLQNVWPQAAVTGSTRTCADGASSKAKGDEENFRQRKPRKRNQARDPS